jgi:hypothetical protein
VREWCPAAAEAARDAARAQGAELDYTIASGSVLERALDDLDGAFAGALDGTQPITYLGLDRPEELPPGSAVFTPANLPELLNPA